MVQEEESAASPGIDPGAANSIGKLALQIYGGMSGSQGASSMLGSSAGGAAFSWLPWVGAAMGIRNLLGNIGGQGNSSWQDDVDTAFHTYGHTFDSRGNALGTGFWLAGANPGGPAMLGWEAPMQQLGNWVTEHAGPVEYFLNPSGLLM